VQEYSGRARNVSITRKKTLDAQNIFQDNHFRVAQHDLSQGFQVQRVTRAGAMDISSQGIPVAWKCDKEDRNFT
jgi:hypothetical protein